MRIDEQADEECTYKKSSCIGQRDEPVFGLYEADADSRNADIRIATMFVFIVI